MSSKKSAYSQAITAITLVPAVRTTGAATGSAVGWGDCQSVMCTIIAGTLTDGSHVVELQDSDDNSSWTAVADAYLLGTEPTITASTDDRTYDIGYTGSRKYLRVTVTSTAATTGGVIGAAFLKAFPYQAPLR